MDARDRNRYRQVRERTATDRSDFIDAEIRTGVTFVLVADSHYGFGQNLEARHARAMASKAFDRASEAMQTARDQGQSTGQLEERMVRLRTSLDDLYIRDQYPDGYQA